MPDVNQNKILPSSKAAVGVPASGFSALPSKRGSASAKAVSAGGESTKHLPLLPNKIPTSGHTPIKGAMRETQPADVGMFEVTTRGG